ncbi:MAG TPA: hypothetical protein VJ719_12910, partial [Chthoniobacterales bacterium]|nr:hypothetical protein [Chthoniobacterales bacterium]
DAATGGVGKKFLPTEITELTAAASPRMRRKSRTSFLPAFLRYPILVVSVASATSSEAGG